MITRTPKKEKPQPKYIHIHAVCPYFEIYEQCLESKSVSRCISIREMFMYEAKRQGHYKKYKAPILGSRHDMGIDAGKLSVKTILINPTLL